MEKQKLTISQKIAYARWSAKLAFGFPYIGIFYEYIVMAIYSGLVFWFWRPEIRSWWHLSGSHTPSKAYLYCLGGLFLIVVLSRITVYVLYFIQALFDEDDGCRKYFLKYHYRKD